MATSTNLGLYLPTRDDYISVKRDISDNMEIIDSAVGANTIGVANIDSGLAYVAVKVGNNWQIPSGKTAQIGDYVIVNGVFGHATAVLTGGSTNIVENTNWVAETNGVLNSIASQISVAIRVVGSFTVPANSNQTFTLPSDGVYMLTGFGSAVAINNVVFLIGGYATASRCSVVNLTGQSTITINSSNTSSLTFTAYNGQANNSITLNIIKLA